MVTKTKVSDHAKIATGMAKGINSVCNFFFL